MIKDFKHIHFIGIKGVGMSALAIVAKQLGYDVSGSDVAETFITDKSLEAAGIIAKVDFKAEHIPAKTDLVVVGAAYGEANPEVKAAMHRRLTLMPYSELLGFLSGKKKTLAIAGTHGKTTTSSLTAFLLHKAKLDPSYVIGTGQVVGLPGHGHGGEGQIFVTEADDYKKAPGDPTPKFLDLSPYGAVVTSIEHDHPDMYETLNDCYQAFFKFACRVKDEGFLVINGDESLTRKLQKDLPEKRYITYGFSHGLDWQIVLGDTHDLNSQKFYLLTEIKKFGPFELKLMGRHNLYNATAAIILASEMGVSIKEIQKILPKFEAVERRYQLVGQKGDIIVIDDYAHHPTAVSLTLETARRQFRGRPIWCFFQSHTYSRTKALLKDFGASFGSAKVVIVTDIFGSARERGGDVTTDDLVREISKHHRNVLYVAHDKLLDFAKQNLPKNAVMITMGAGDIYKIGHALVKDSKK